MRIRRPTLLGVRIQKRLIEQQGFTRCVACQQLVAPGTMEQHLAGHGRTLAMPSVKVGRELELDPRD